MEKQRITIGGKAYDIEINEVGNKTLGESALGTPVNIGGMILRPIAHEGDATLCLLQDLYKDGKRFEFGNNGNWAESPIRKELNAEFYKDLAKAVGKDNICPLKTNLWALDGTRPYPDCEDKVALLDVDQYRQHREYIDEKGQWHWLVTPDSEKWSRYVCIVYGDGALSYYDCDCVRTVRPFCILKSNIFVSEEK